MSSDSVSSEGAEREHVFMSLWWDRASRADAVLMVPESLFVACNLEYCLTLDINQLHINMCSRTPVQEPSIISPRAPPPSFPPPPPYLEMSQMSQVLQI